MTNRKINQLVKQITDTNALKVIVGILHDKVQLQKQLTEAKEMEHELRAQLKQFQQSI